jgi:hypothetical protein
MWLSAMRRLSERHGPWDSTACAGRTREALAARRRGTPRAGRLSTPVLWLLVLVTAGAGSAEQVLVQGMGRTHGWLVATDDGALAFVDCQGRLFDALGGVRIEPSTGRCPSSPAPVEVTGVIHSVDAARRIVRAEDEGGRVHVFYVGDDRAALGDLRPGERIRAIGPVAGHASRITRP